MKKLLFFLILTASVTFGQNQFNWYRQTTYLASGTNTYDATIASLPIITDQVISVNFTNPNTSTTPTININGTGAKTIQSGGIALSSGQLRGQRTLKYNGTNWQLQGDGGGSGWRLAGNTATNQATDFIGTTDNVNFNIRTNNVNRATFTGAGNFTLGSVTSQGSARPIITISPTGNAIQGAIGLYTADATSAIPNHINLMAGNTTDGISRLWSIVLNSGSHTNFTTGASDVDNSKILFNPSSTEINGVPTNNRISGVYIRTQTLSATNALTVPTATSLLIDPPTIATNLTVTNNYTIESRGRLFTYDLRIGNLPETDNTVTSVLARNVITGEVVTRNGVASGVNFSKYVPTTVTNTTTETSLLGTGSGTSTILANELVLGKRYRVSFITFTSTPNATSRTVTIRLKIGGVTANTITQTFSSIANLQFNNFSGEFVCTATGTSGSVYLELINIVVPNTSNVAVNTTINNAIDVTAQWSDAVAGNTLTCNSLSITPLN